MLGAAADSSGHLPDLSLGERAVPLVDYQGGTYTLGEAYEELRGGAVNRPNFQSLASVDHWLEARAVDRVLIREAVRRRYGDDPALQRTLRERLNDYLIESFYTKEVVLPVKNVEELRPLPTSLMPAGQLAGLTAQEAADLLEYLAGRK